MTARTLKKLSIALALSAMTAGAVAPAQAHDRDYGRYDYRYDRYGGYDRYGRNDVTIRYENDGRGYRDRDYRDYRDDRCHRSDGTAGTIIGAIAGGLIGSSAAGRHGDKTAGALIGGGIGAVAGRAIDKSSNDCR